MKAIEFLQQIAYYETEFCRWQIWDFTKQFLNPVEWIISESDDIKRITKRLFSARYILIVWAELDDAGNIEKEFSFSEEPDGICTLKGYETECHIYVIE